jgi:HAE1 family hydrophobic/amphiphilic exporter-1
MSDELVKKFEAEPYLFGVKTTFALPSPETQVVVDKDRAAGFQMSVADIARAALIAIKGYVATEFKEEGGKELDIRVRLRQQDRQNSDSIRQLALRSPQGTMIPLDGVAKVNPGMGASEIRHMDQQRALIVSAEVSGMSVDKALGRVQRIIQPYKAFKDYNVELGGEGRRIAESFSGLKYTFLLALLLVYMIMASQFENLSQPLIIMTTVPFSIIGIAFTLFISNTPLSSVVALGVIILAGVVVNNGIVLIDHINVLRREGKDLSEAVTRGSINRLRPILVTTLTTILAVLPMILGIGKGDELSQPLAIVTFGGLLVSTTLTLFAIPLGYYEMEKWRAKKMAVVPLGKSVMTVP